MTGKTRKLLFFTLVTTLMSIEAYNSDMVEAVAQVVLSKHRHEIKEINFINATKAENHLEINDYLDKLLPRIGSKITLRWIDLAQRNITKRRFFFVAILIDALESFQSLLKKIKSNHFDYNGYYLIIFNNASTLDLKNMFEKFWNLYIRNVNVVTRNRVKGTIAVMNFVPFSEYGCNNTEPVQLAEFENGKFKSRPSSFFADKFKDLSNCPIKITTFETIAPSVLKEDFPNGTRRMYGRDMDVVEALGKELNFRPIINYMEPYGSWGLLFKNGSATGALGKAIRREADLILGNMLLKADRLKVMEHSYTYYMDRLVFLIPPGYPLTSFQKLLRPFNFVVWIFLSLTLLCGFAVIAILQIKSNHTRKLVFGEGITTPYMNVLIALFGGSQHVLPKKNFPRYLLMMFLLFCLVIR